MFYHLQRRRRRRKWWTTFRMAFLTFHYCLLCLFSLFIFSLSEFHPNFTENLVCKQCYLFLSDIFDGNGFYVCFWWMTLEYYWQKPFILSRDCYNLFTQLIDLSLYSTSLLIAWKVYLLFMWAYEVDVNWNGRKNRKSNPHFDGKLQHSEHFCYWSNWNYWQNETDR